MLSRTSTVVPRGMQCWHFAQSQKAIMTDMIARTPISSACYSCHTTTYATLSDVSDTLRLLTDSMDFLDADADCNAWMVLGFLCESVSCIGGQIEAKSALLLWMLKLFTYELKTHYIRSQIAKLLYSILDPHPGSEPASNWLLKLGDADIIDVAPKAIDGYTALHKRLAYAEGPEMVSSVLGKGPNLHLLGFDKDYTPEKESSTSLAMYSSWAFADWRHELVAIGVDLVTFIDQELKNNALVHPGWDKETLRYLFDYPTRPELDIREEEFCYDCNYFIARVRIQPYWRHVLERIKQRTDPDDPSRSHLETRGRKHADVDGISEATNRSNDRGHEPDLTGDVIFDDSEAFSGSESASEVELGSDVHGYPENVPIQSDCMYDSDEVVCMDCWLHYRRSGTRFKFEDSSVDEYPSSEEGSSDDEFSPYHIHS